MGLSAEEFRRLTPDEFNAVYKEWRDMADSEARGAWERCRWICWYILRPYAKRSFKRTDVMRFDWDGQTGAPRRMTPEERAKEKEEFEKLQELWKDGDEQQEG